LKSGALAISCDFWILVGEAEINSTVSEAKKILSILAISENSEANPVAFWNKYF